MVDINRMVFGLSILPNRELTIWKRGATRECFLIGSWAIKMPSMAGWKPILNGLLANMQEKQFSKTGWDELCPVKFYIPGGFMLVMPVVSPLNNSEWNDFDYDLFCNKPDYVVPAENKRSSFGVYKGKIVAIDYGS